MALSNTLKNRSRDELNQDEAKQIEQQLAKLLVEALGKHENRQVKPHLAVNNDAKAGNSCKQPSSEWCSCFSCKRTRKDAGQRLCELAGHVLTKRVEEGTVTKEVAAELAKPSARCFADAFEPGSDLSNAILNLATLKARRSGNGKHSLYMLPGDGAFGPLHEPLAELMRAHGGSGKVSKLGVHWYEDAMLWLQLAYAESCGASPKQLDELEQVARSRANLGRHVDHLRQEKPSGEGDHDFTLIVTIQAPVGDGTTFFRNGQAFTFDGQEKPGSCVHIGSLANCPDAGGFDHAVVRGPNPYTGLSRGEAVRHALLQLADDHVQGRATGRVTAVVWGPTKNPRVDLDGAERVAQEEVESYMHRQVALKELPSLPLTPRSSPPQPLPSQPQPLPLPSSPSASPNTSKEVPQQAQVKGLTLA